MPLSRIAALFGAITATALLAPTPAQAQTFHSDDPVIRRMWEEGMERSQVETLAQVLLDSIGPRLAGTPALDAAAAWLLGTYAAWGVPARKEQVGTWIGWRHGLTHVDMVAPRRQTLEATILGFSAGTDGPVEGDVVTIPALASEAEMAAWLPSVAGKIVLLSPPEVMCRAPHELEQNAAPETVARLDSIRAATERGYRSRLALLGGRRAGSRLDEAGAVGVVTSEWSGGWGVNKVFTSPTRRAVGVDVSCEHYGMLFRMAEHGQNPRLRIEAEAEVLPEVPQFNVVAELKGTELPDEYVVLTAHYDSFHAAQGATDNGTGTIMMLEAMRILNETYPNPRRTILAGHWVNEEMGLVGSAAFREDHPEVVEGLQVLFNQDNGTWRVERIEGQGFLRAGPHIARWISEVPAEISDHITLEFPGAQNNRGSDHSSFVCAGAPAFRLQAPYDEYRQYTWHTNRDTYDKIVFDDLKSNATLAAMLAYGASEDPERVPRDKALLPPDPRTGEPRAWGNCFPARRSP
jgi:carboxypeptidase Q